MVWTGKMNPITKESIAKPKHVFMITRVTWSLKIDNTYKIIEYKVNV